MNYWVGSRETQFSYAVLLSNIVEADIQNAETFFKMLILKKFSYDTLL